MSAQVLPFPAAHRAHRAHLHVLAGALDALLATRQVTPPTLLALWEVAQAGHTGDVAKAAWGVLEILQAYAPHDLEFSN